MRAARFTFELTPLTIGIVLAVYSLLVVTGAFMPLGNGVQYGLRPLQRVSANVAQSIGGFFDRFRSSPELSEELEKARAENTRLTVENAQLRAQIENSLDIQAQQSFLAPRTLEAVFAQVIGRSPLPDHETILLDRGSDDGVVKGTPIVVGEGIYIGRILSVAAHTSVALMAVDSDHHVAAIVQNASRSPGELRGERGLGMRLELIPRTDTLAVGETIVTSGLDPLIPEGLVLGHVARDTTQTGDLFQSVDVEQAAIPSRLRIVAILLTPQA